MTAEERERDLLTAVASLQATLAAKQARIESLESELKAAHVLIGHSYALERAVEDARNAQANVLSIHEMNLEMQQQSRESWDRDRDSFIAERDRLNAKLRELQKVEGENDQLRREIRDLKGRLAWAERA